MHYFSNKTGLFYVKSIHGNNIPSDAVDVTDAKYTELQKARSEGMLIVLDDSGHPIAIAPPADVRTKESLLTEVANRRWQVEMGGIIVNGCAIDTGSESQAKINAVYVSLSSGLITDTQWKMADGLFELVTLEKLAPIALAVAAHVRACFVAEHTHVAAITALQTQAELDSYDINTGWPESLS